MEYEPNCLPSCKLDDNDNEISHLQNDFNNENVSNKSVIPADENYIRYGLSESDSSVISNLQFFNGEHIICHEKVFPENFIMHDDIIRILVEELERARSSADL